MAHYADKLPLPDKARAYLRRFRSVETTWQECKQGVYMAWLVSVTADSDADRDELSAAVDEATQKLQLGIEQYYKAVNSRDPNAALPLAYRLVVDELAVANGTLDEKSLGKPPSPPPAEYDAYRAQAHEVVSDVIRKKIYAPSI